MPKQLILGEDARTKLFQGVKQLNDAVSATMGPKGRNVVIERPYGSPMVTKDGVSVAKEIELEDSYENMGAQLVKEAATKTNDAAGDGTTTATVLAHAVIEAGLSHLGSGANPILIKRGIDTAVAEVSKHLASIAKPVTKKDEYAAVATISAQDAEIGELIAGVFEKVGKDGVVTVEPGATMGVETEHVEGMQLDNGFLSPYFVTEKDRPVAEVVNPLILVTDENITNIQDLLPTLDIIVENKRRLVIIADGVGSQVLAVLVVNKMQGRFESLAVKAPAFGERRKEMLKDIAVLTGATFISQEVGRTLDSVTLDDLGTAAKVTATKNTTLIVGGAGDGAQVAARVGDIRSLLANTSSEFEKEKLQERLAKLTGGIAVIRVGAATEVEQKEKQHRVEDALSATRAAAEEGIVPGGGTAYLRCIPVLEKLAKNAATSDEKTGIEIVIEALLAPLSCIARNSGANATSVVGNVLEAKGNEGYNALTGEFEDLVKAMVIDPKKVSRTALENAASVAAMFLTLEVGVVSVKEKTSQSEL